MDRHFLRKNGFTLFEVTLGLIIIGVLMLGGILLASGQRKQALAAQTLKSLNNLASACSQYHSKYGGWPSEIADLQPEFISPSFTGINPFGNSYNITSTSLRLTVSTLVPAERINQSFEGSSVLIQNQGVNDLISMSQLIPGAKTRRLKYDKKYLYGE